MGYELLTQPQVFRVKLSALGGIEGYAPPYITSFYTWTITTPSVGNTFTIPFDNSVGGPGLNHDTRGSFIVNISGLIVSPTQYSINPDFRTITFNNSLSSDTTFTITQIGSIALSTANYQSLTGTNFVSTNAAITNINSSSIQSSQIQATNFTSTNIATTNIATTNLTSNNLQTSNISILNKITTPLRVTNLSADSFVVDTNSSLDAVRITQRGSGNVILVEDSTNPDSTPFVVTSGGDIGMGGLNPTQKLDVIGKIRGQGFVNTAADILSSTSVNGNFRITQQDGTGRVNMAWNVDGSAIGTGTYLTDDPALRFRISTDGFTFFTAGASISGSPITWSTGLYNSITNRIGIRTTTPSSVLHIIAADAENKIIQETTSGAISPKVSQYLTPDYFTTEAGMEVFDPINPYFFANARSHTLDFERIPPIQPVYWWYFREPTAKTVFNLSGGPLLQSQSHAYVVAVGGVIQPSTVYTVNPSTRNLTFTTQTIPANRSVYVLQTLNPLLSEGYDSIPTQFVSASPANVGTTTFRLTGLSAPLTTVLGQYLVGVDGVYQIPNNPPYTITPSTSTITFVCDVPKDLTVTVTKLPSAVSRVGLMEEACFLSQFYTWTFKVTNNSSTFSLPGGPSCLLTNKNCYLVNVGGELQVPFSYNIDPIQRRILFNGVILGGVSPSGIDVAVTQLAAPEFPIKYSTVFKLIDDCREDCSVLTADAEEVLRLRPGAAKVAGNISTSIPEFVTTSTYTVPFSTSSIVFNVAGTCTVTLPPAARNPGRWLHVKTVSNNSVNSSQTNILPLANNNLTSSILSNTAGKWAQLQCNGSNWVVMAGN